MGEKSRLLSNKGATDSGTYGTIKFENLDEKNPKRCLITRRDVILVMVVLTIAAAAIIASLSIGLPKLREKRHLYYNPTFPISDLPIHTFEKAALIIDGEPCAAIGRDIMIKNGSAVDAAIAMLFCNGVVTPQSMGLGGGFLMTIYIKSKGVAEVIDSREIAPLNSSWDMYHSNESMQYSGGLSIAVPGELKGYQLAHQKYGKLKWADLVRPSIALCRDGFSVSSHLADKLQSKKDAILDNPDMRMEFFNNETGELYKEDELLKRPILGETLSKIAEQGESVLYDGELSAKLIQDIHQCGGILTLDDLKHYEAKSTPGLKIPLGNGDTMHTVPPPGSGGVLGYILNILHGYNITEEVLDQIEDTTLLYHRIIEAFKYGFAKRSELGDSDFVNITQSIDQMTSLEYAEATRRKISDDTTFPPEHYESVHYSPDDHGTAHLSILAANGDAVSATSTINAVFGSMCISSSTGIILNNEMDDFSSPNITNYFGVVSSPPNYIAPGKRPLSSMTPSVIVDKSGNVKLVIGGNGGTRIITSVALTILRLLWLDQDVKTALDALRFHHQLYPNLVQYEHGFPMIYRDHLKKFGHQFGLDYEGSVVLGILRNENGTLEACLDHRKSGSVSGF